MSDHQTKPSNSSVDFVRKMAQETGLSEKQINDLISMVGYNYSSVIREARALKQQN